MRFSDFVLISGNANERGDCPPRPLGELSFLVNRLFLVGFFQFSVDLKNNLFAFLTLVLVTLDNFSN